MMKEVVFCILGVLTCQAGMAKGLPADLRGGTCVDFDVTSRALAARSPQTAKADIRLSPMGWVDHRFVLSEGQPGLMTFVIKGSEGFTEEARMWEAQDRADRASALPRYPMRLEMEIPAGVEIVDVADGQQLSCTPTAFGHHYVFAMSADFDMTFSRRYGMKDEYNWWRKLGFLVKSAGCAGATYPAAKVYLTWKGKRFTNEEPVLFSVMPAVRAQPGAYRRFHLGFSTGGIYPNFSFPGFDAWSAFATGCGADAMQPDFRNDTLKARQIGILRKNGVSLLTPVPTGCPVYNGYVIGDEKGRPETDRFTSTPAILDKATAHARKALEQGTCPSAVYERHPFFLTNTVPLMAKAFAGYDGIWCNWEPFSFMGRGCFCARCRAKFAAFVGESVATLATDWPAAVLKGGRRHREFLRFSSGEHAKLMRVVAEEVKKVCGGAACPAGFIPGVAWCEMASNWRESDYAKEVRPYDYAKGFDWISPWGPYAIYPTQSPYVYSKWRNLRTFIAAKDVRTQVNKDYAPAERPKLMAYPHGLQCDDWICYPEALEMNIDSFFFNGWEAVSVYHFPKGYDARWWAAFARSADKAKKYDDIVFGGRRIDEEVSLALTVPYAAPNSNEGTATRGLDIKKPMLQHVAYEKDGRLVVAVFNFWEKGPAFFRVTHRGKELGEFYCGALRTKVWEFGPGVTRDFSAEDVAAWRTALLPELQRAKAADAQYEATCGGRENKLENVVSGDIVGTADNVAETLTFISGTNRIVVDCARMSVREWAAKGRVVVSNAVLGAVTFWQPRATINGGKFRVISQMKGKGWAAVAGRQRITAAVSAELQALDIYQVIYVFKDLGKIEIRTTLTNGSTDEQPKHFELGLAYGDMEQVRPQCHIRRTGAASRPDRFDVTPLGIGAKADYVLILEASE